MSSELTPEEMAELPSLRRMIADELRARDSGGEAVNGLAPVRNDCAFCHYERSAADDNHHPTCTYWHLFGDPSLPCPCYRCTGSVDPRTLRVRNDGYRKENGS